MQKYLLTLVITTVVLVIPLQAEDVSFTATAPDAVANGQTFQLVYSVNASAKELRIPEIPDFEIVAGPFQSKSASTQIVNGNIMHSMSLRFTYTLLPKKEGTFTIPAATIMVDKQKYSSNTLTIKVLPAEETTPSNNNIGISAQKTQAQNQKFKLAVYATGNMEIPLKNIAQNTASTELVNGGRYQMIERSSEFLKIVSTEQNYQRSGEVDDNQIAELGKQYGADCVCVVDITILDTYLYVATRMIDVVKATSQSAGDAENTNYSTPADLRKCVIASVKKMEGIKNNSEQSVREKEQSNQMAGVFGQQKTGEGSSGGNTWSLNNRTLISPLYKPVYNSDEEGIIFVSICVNENGDVVAASIASGTTISDKNLLNASISAAKKIKFSSGTNVIIGTIRYNFKLN